MSKIINIEIGWKEKSLLHYDLKYIQLNTYTKKKFMITLKKILFIILANA